MSGAKVFFEGESVGDIVAKYDGKTFYSAGHGMALNGTIVYKYDLPFPERRERTINHILLQFYHERHYPRK